MKKEEKNIIPALEIENKSTEEIAFRATQLPYLASEAIEKLAKLLPEAFAKNIDRIPSEIEEKTKIISMANSLESGYALTQSVAREYRPFALQLKKILENEYDCKTSLEKMIVEHAVNSHIRILYYSWIMDQSIFVALGERGSHENNRFLAFLSKEIDRAIRQCTSAIDTLKSIKQPSLKINIKTQNAFLGDKQQFNSNMQNNEPN